MGWFHGYDGNIVGGALVGAGMTLTGACPGTVLVQLTTGVPSAPYALLGALVGGIAFARFSTSLRRSPPGYDPSKATVHAKYNFDINYVILAYEVLCAAVIGLVSALGPGSSYTSLSPIVGGIMLGGAQAASLILTSNPVGVSTAYEELGQLFWRTWDSIFHPSDKPTPAPHIKSLPFTMGILPGSLLLANTLALSPVGPEPHIPPLTAFLGGVAMVFGGRLAGGCTSGHGISGMAQFSIASIVSVAAMFVAGMGLAVVL
jgi:uncharacterized membrane protein YedE/YeeE